MSFWDITAKNYVVKTIIPFNLFNRTFQIFNEQYVVDLSGNVYWAVEYIYMYVFQKEVIGKTVTESQFREHNGN